MSRPERRVADRAVDAVPKPPGLLPERARHPLSAPVMALGPAAISWSAAHVVQPPHMMRAATDIGDGRRP